jgi:hypothetical protein
MDASKCANCGEVTQMNDWFETEWAGVAQVFRLRRSVKDGDKQRQETVSGFTHLSEARKPMLLVCSLYNKPIGASKIVSIIGEMSRMARRCLPGPSGWCSPGVGGP